MRLLSLIIIGGISYYAYTQYNTQSNNQYNTPIKIDEKNLPNIRKLDHNKTNNLLYDPNTTTNVGTNTNIKIVHHFKSQVMPRSYNYATI